MERYYKTISNSLRNVLGKALKSDAEKNRLLYRLKYAINQIEHTYLEIALDELKQVIILRHKTESIHEILTNVKIAKEKVEKHHNRISWQIQRLYRIQKEIAHAALQDQNLLIAYVEHLYDYLSTYTSEIITCMIENGQKSIEEALCLIKDNYDAFIAYAENNERDMLQESVLKSGVIDFVRI